MITRFDKMIYDVLPYLSQLNCDAMALLKRILWYVSLLQKYSGYRFLRQSFTGLLGAGGPIYVYVVFWL